MKLTFSITLYQYYRPRSSCIHSRKNRIVHMNGFWREAAQIKLIWSAWRQELKIFLKSSTSLPNFFTNWTLFCLYVMVNQTHFSWPLILFISNVENVIFAQWTWIFHALEFHIHLREIMTWKRHVTFESIIGSKSWIVPILATNL